MVRMELVIVVCVLYKRDAIVSVCGLYNVIFFSFSRYVHTIVYKVAKWRRMTMGRVGGIALYAYGKS